MTERCGGFRRLLEFRLADMACRAGSAGCFRRYDLFKMFIMFDLLLIFDVGVEVTWVLPPPRGVY